MRILILSGASGDPRAASFADGLRSHGHAVAVASPDRRAARQSPDAVVTFGPGASAHLTGAALQRTGVTWVLDAAEAFTPRLEGRLHRVADLVTVPDAERLNELHKRTGGPVAVAPTDDPVPADGTVLRQLAARAALEEPGRLRVLMIGPFNSPHLEHMALELHERGVALLVGGESWPELPPSVLPSAGVPVDAATFPLVAWLGRVRRSFRPDVVHAHWMPFAFKALAARARPLVAMPWGSDVYRVEGAFHHANVVVARFADEILTDSNDLADAMVALGAKRERIEVLNWGVDLQQFTPPTDDERKALRARLGLSDGPVVLSPRSLKPLYHPEVIVAAFEQLRERVPGAQLVLKHMSAEPPPELGSLPEGVTIVGHVAYEEMVDWYRVADVCVSVAETDSSPRSVWEAMAAGCPCVVSELPWVEELLEHGRDVLAVPIEAGAVAGALERLLTDEELHARLAAEGRALVERERDQDREMQRLIGLLEAAAQGPNG